MAIQLKQRIIGAVVLFGLLIIFLPMIFENNPEQQQVEHLLNVQDADTKSNAKLLNPADKPKQRDERGAARAVLQYGEHANKTLTEDMSELESFNAEAEAKFMPDSVAKKETPSKQIQLDTKAAREHSDKSTFDRAIKYSVDKNNVIAKTNIYAIKIITVDKQNSAEHVKNLLMAKGFPAYINFDREKNSYTVYTGPDLELKYIQELTKRIIAETDYQPEIVAHNKNWLTE